MAVRHTSRTVPAVILLVFPTLMASELRASDSHTETLAWFTFSEEDATPELTAAGISVSILELSWGTLSFGSFSGFGDPPYAQGRGDWDIGNPQSGRHFFFDVSTHEDYVMDLSEIRLLARATSAGPSAITIAVDETAISTVDLPAGQTLEIMSPVQLTDITSARVKIIGWANGSRPTPGSGDLRIDDIRLSGSVSTSDVLPPTDFAAHTESPHRTGLQWNLNSDSDDILLLWNSQAAFGQPSGTYTSGDEVDGGGTVLAVGNLSRTIHEDLVPGTEYYYRIHTVTTGGSFSSGVSASAVTSKLPPSRHVTDLGAVGGIQSIRLTWVEPVAGVTADGYLIKGSSAGFADIAPPVSGIPEADDPDLSDGAGRVNLTAGTEWYTFTDVPANQPFYFKVFPVTNSGDRTSYKLDGEIPSAVAYAQGTNALEVVHYWSFNNTGEREDQSPWSERLAADVGSGELTHSFLPGSTEAQQGTALNTHEAADSGTALAVSGSANNRQHIELEVPAGLHQNLVLSYALRTTASGFSSHEIQYSTGGADFKPYTTLTDLPVGNFDLVRVDLSPVIEANFSSSLRLRIVIDGATHASGNNRIDNLRLSGIPAGMITGNAGWRMLSVPADGITWNDIAMQTPVQGISGSPQSADEASLYDHYESDGSQGSTGWHVPSSLQEEVTPGKGFLLYFFDNEKSGSNTLPVRLETGGKPPTSDVSIDLHQTTDGWNLLGNPFLQPIDFSQIQIHGGILASKVGQIWSSTLESYILTTITNGRIAPWQGFFVQNDDAATVTIPAAAKSEGGVFFKNVPVPSRTLSIQLTGTDSETGHVVRDHATVLHFHEQAHEGWDEWDAEKLTPLSYPYATLSFPGERDGRLVLKAQDSRPYNLYSQISVPISLISRGISGDFHIGWPQIRNIPETWSLLLIDHATGEATDMRVNDRYSFAHKSSGVGKAASAVPGGSLRLDAGDADKPRFSLVISDGAVHRKKYRSSLPDHVTLHPNYPNPFNPGTTFSYELPKSTHVELHVFDVLGRRVATLVSGVRPAGSHTVEWYADEVSSGVYFGRLEADGIHLTRRIAVTR